MPRVTHIVGHPSVDEITQELHDTAVGIPVIQGGGGNGPLQDGDHHLAA